MSRIGKKPINIPAGVTVEVAPGRVEVKGPKGALTRVLHPGVTVVVDGAMVQVGLTPAAAKDKELVPLWGTFASHVRNMIEGVTVGFKKQLEVNGVGYRVAMQGADVKLDVGFSHPVIFATPKGVTITVEKNVITLVSADKELLGAAAADIRAIRKPEPYKGKGIKYMDETIRRKAGKSAKAGA